MSEFSVAVKSRLLYLKKEKNKISISTSGTVYQNYGETFHNEGLRNLNSHQILFGW